MVNILRFKMKKRTLPSWMQNASERQTSHVHSSTSAVNHAADLPLIHYKGSLVYCHHHGECSLLCEEILDSLEMDSHCVAGLDIEWPVTYKAKQSGKTATIQLCLSPSKCYIFHVSAMTECPKVLLSLLADQRLTKVGVNIEGDLWKLGRDFDFPSQAVIRESVVELSTYANKVLNSSGRWSLDGLTQNLLRQRLDKNPDVRLGKWDEYPLPDQLQIYAATDAYVSLMLYMELNGRSSS